jgi:hypothetical protein
MNGKILDGFGSKFAEKWVATLLTPAFVFWLGGFVTVVQKGGWPVLLKEFTRHPELIQVAILIGCLSIVTVSGFVVQRFDLATLRFLEGYWHPLLCQKGIQRYQKIREQLRKDSQKLRNKEANRKRLQQRLKNKIDSLGADVLTPKRKKLYLQLNKSIFTPIEQIKLVQIRQSLREMPTAYADLMPMRLGNLLRAAERQPLNKYGLDAIICWSRLWMLLPEAVRKDLQEARNDLNSAARLWLWSILFCGWSFLGMGWSYWVNRSQKWMLPEACTVDRWDIFSCGWLFLSQGVLAIWALLLGLLSAWFAYRWAIDAARTYGALIEASFDIYRHLLYESQRWHLPPDPEEERRRGRKFTQYLANGFFEG